MSRKYGIQLQHTIAKGKVLLELNALTLSPRLLDVSLRCDRGQWWTLLGPNGAGKSTLLSLVAGVISPSSGSVLLDNRALGDIGLNALASRRCLVTQSYRTEFAISVAETLYFFTRSRDIPELLEKSLEIKPLLNKAFESLSGGEKQRVHLARNFMQIWQAITKGNALILLDEPLQQMDIRHQVTTLDLIRLLQNMGNIIVMSHHDINQSAQYSTHVAFLKHAQLLAQGSATEVINKDSLGSLYDQAFIVIPREQQSAGYYLAKNKIS